MNKYLKNLLALTLILSVGFFSACSDDDDDIHSPIEIVKKNNTALLLCSFSSTYKQPQTTSDQIRSDYKAAYPNTDICRLLAIRTIWLNHMKEAIENAESWNERLGE